MTKHNNIREALAAYRRDKEGLAIVASWDGYATATRQEVEALTGLAADAVTLDSLEAGGMSALDAAMEVCAA